MEYKVGQRYRLIDGEIIQSIEYVKSEATANENH